jgi:hypothetical protein
MIRLLDIVELDLIQPRTVHVYQKENRIIRNWNWGIKKRLNLAAVSQFIDPTTPVLHSGGDRVDPALLQKLPAHEWTSLQLIKPKNLCFSRHHWDPNRWVARFNDSNGNEYSIKVTDPDATRRLENGMRISKNSLLTVSMTKPWTHNSAETPARCYKVVAAVIEVG